MSDRKQEREKIWGEEKRRREQQNGRMRKSQPGMKQGRSREHSDKGALEERKRKAGADMVVMRGF